jgi:hypothetical protein
LAVETRAINMTEVVAAQRFTAAATTGRSGRHTDVPKAITQFAAIGNSQVCSTDQAGDAFGIAIAVTLSLTTWTINMTEALVTMTATHAATTTTGGIAGVGRLMTDLAAGTGITTRLATAGNTSLGSIAVETVVTIGIGGTVRRC